MRQVLAHPFFRGGGGDTRIAALCEQVKGLNAGIGRLEDGQDKIQAAIEAGVAALSGQMSKLGDMVENQLGVVVQMLADESLPRVPRFVIVKPLKAEDLTAAVESAPSWSKRFAATMSQYKAKAKVSKFYDILIMDEGPFLPEEVEGTWPDAECAPAIDDPEVAMALEDPQDLHAKDDHRGVANHPGWRVELFGDRLARIAPAMMVVAKVLPTIVKVTTGVSVRLPNLGLGGKVAEQFAEFGSAFGSMLEEEHVAGIIQGMENTGEVAPSRLLSLHTFPHHTTVTIGFIASPPGASQPVTECP